MKDRRQVTHVTFSPLGGAGAVAVRLDRAQRELDWQSRLVTFVQTPFPRWVGRHPVVAAAALADYYGVRKPATASFFSLYRKQHAARTAQQLAAREGVLHLHLLNGFIWPPALFAQPIKATPIVWSVQDLWPITGGCHYTNGCDRFTESCTDCPQVHAIFRRVVAASLARKREGVEKRPDLLVVTPSEWARDLVRRSAVMRHVETAVIPNPIDTDVFRPLDRDAIRAAMHIDPNSFVIGVGAANIADERKQIPQTLRTLHDWLTAQHPERPVRILIFGAGARDTSLSDTFQYLGPSAHTDQLATWYNAMDAYVSLSRYETFGNTLAEAAACGTPSVCLTGSGTAEVVRDGITGRHIRTIDALPQALADWIHTPEAAKHAGESARQDAVVRFSDRAVAAAFIARYENPPGHGDAS